MPYLAKRELRALSKSSFNSLRRVIASSTVRLAAAILKDSWVWGAMILATIFCKDPCFLRISTTCRGSRRKLIAKLALKFCKSLVELWAGTSNFCTVRSYISTLETKGGL